MPQDPRLPLPKTQDQEGWKPISDSAKGGSIPSRVLNVLRDPRAQAYLMSVAQGLMQPRGAGQTGAGNVVNALTQGHNSVALAQAMQYQRDMAMREEQRKQAESQAGIAATQASTQRTIEMTPQEVANAEKARAATDVRMEQDRAQTKEIGIGSKRADKIAKANKKAAERAHYLNEDQLTEERNKNLMLYQKSKDELAALERDRADKNVIATKRAETDRLAQKSRQSYESAMAGWYSSQRGAASEQATKAKTEQIFADHYDNVLREQLKSNSVIGQSPEIQQAILDKAIAAARTSTNAMRKEFEAAQAEAQGAVGGGAKSKLDPELMGTIITMPNGEKRKRVGINPKTGNWVLEVQPK